MSVAVTVLAGVGVFLCGAFVTVYAKRRWRRSFAGMALMAVIAMLGFAFSMRLVWLMFGAPDVVFVVSYAFLDAALASLLALLVKTGGDVRTRPDGGDPTQ